MSLLNNTDGNKNIDVYGRAKIIMKDEEDALDLKQRVVRMIKAGDIFTLIKMVTFV